MYAKKDLTNSSRLARIRDPILEEKDREKAMQLIDMHATQRYGNWIAGRNRIFDKISDTYGNSFINFHTWPKDAHLDPQAHAEYLIISSFIAQVQSMVGAGGLPREYGNSVVWMAKAGLLMSAAATVNSAIFLGGDAGKDGADETP